MPASLRFAPRFSDPIDEVVAIDADLLWSSEYERDHTGFRRMWLRLAWDIALSGRPVVLFGAGFAVPHNVEPLPERVAFSSVHFLALTCDDDVLAARIRSRKPPRRTDDAQLKEHVDYNGWLRTNARATEPPNHLDRHHALPCGRGRSKRRSMGSGHDSRRASRHREQRR